MLTSTATQPSTTCKYSIARFGQSGQCRASQWTAIVTFGCEYLVYIQAEGIVLDSNNLHCKQGEKHLWRVLNTNSYPKRFISSATSPPMWRHSSQERTPKTTITIPYVAGVSNAIRRICRGFDVRMAFKAGRTLRSLMTNVKDPLPVEKQSIVVYQIPCSCGQVETIRRLETRLKEHKDACSKGQTEKSAVVEHAWKNNHPIK